MVTARGRTPQSKLDALIAACTVACCARVPPTTSRLPPEASADGAKAPRQAATRRMSRARRTALAACGGEATPHIPEPGRPARGTGGWWLPAPGDVFHSAGRGTDSPRDEQPGRNDRDRRPE